MKTIRFLARNSIWKIQDEGMSPKCFEGKSWWPQRGRRDDNAVLIRCPARNCAGTSEAGDKTPARATRCSLHAALWIPCPGAFRR